MSVSPPPDADTAAIADCTTSSASLREETTRSTTLARSSYSARSKKKMCEYATAT